MLHSPALTRDFGCLHRGYNLEDLAHRLSFREGGSARPTNGTISRKKDDRRVDQGNDK